MLCTKLGFFADLGGCFITPPGAGRLLAWQVETFGGGGGGGGALVGGGCSLITKNHEKFMSAKHFTLTKVFKSSSLVTGLWGRGPLVYTWAGDVVGFDTLG